MSKLQIEFLGAAGGVTGSRTLIRYEDEVVLVDCGLFQGPKEVRQRNWDSVFPNVAAIQAVVLTHAHLDHCGYLPCLYQQGFNGPIYCSVGTASLCKLILEDAAYLEEELAHYANLSGYSNHKPAKPLFTRDDVRAVLPMITPRPRDEWQVLTKSISVRFLQAGHIIGASMVQLAFSGPGGPRLLTFSGDLGHQRSLTMVPPASLLETDTLVMESTYCDREHPRTNVLDEFAEIAERTLTRKGVLLIPAFAVGRAQEVLYIIHCLEAQNRIPSVPVILDSPMAEAATKVFMAHPEDHRLGNLSESTKSFLPRFFTTTPTSNDSMLACMRDGPMIVISAAGMLSGGRVLHHLKRRLPIDINTILFCGYQADGTKGRFLQDNAGQLETLRIHHQEVPIEAEIATIQSLSAHGDYLDLIEWFDQIEKKPTKVFLNHGSQESLTSFAEKLSRKFPEISFQPILEPQKIKI